MLRLIHKLKNSTLRNKAILISLVLITFPAFFYSIYLFTSYENSLYSQVTKDKETAIEQLAENIKTSLLSVQNLTRDLAYSTPVVSLLTKGNLNMYPIYSEKYTEEIIMDLKYSLKYQNIDFLDACIYTNTLGFKEGNSFYPESALLEQSFYLNFVNSKDYFHLYLLNEEETKLYYRMKDGKDTSKKSIILFVQDILSNSGTYSLGKLILEASPEVVFQPIMQRPDYCIWFSGAQRLFGSIENTDIDLSKVNVSAKGTLTQNKNTYFVYPIEDFDIFVYDSEYINQRDYVISAIRLILIVVWISIMEFIILTFMIQHTFNSINNSLNELDGIIDNSFSGKIDESRTDEIGQIAKRYNVMLDHITALVADLIKKEEMSKQAQSKALQYQINPHFIYNTLSIFAGHAELSKNYELAEAISYFGHLLRYNLHDNGRYATIRQELDNAISLVKIYSIKCSNQITLTTNIEERLNNWKVIKCLLQPILENSILHGQRSTSNHLQITIDVTEINDKLMIQITDNGIGMSTDKLKEVQTRLQSDIKETKPENHSGSYIGLRNIYERLHLFYGDHFSMRIESEVNSFTRIQLSIPAAPAEGVPLITNNS